MRKGFTLIELLIVLGVMTIASVGVAALYGDNRSQAVLNDQVQIITQQLTNVSAKARSQDGGYQWWMHFDNPSSGNDFMSLCYGTSYTAPGISCVTEGVEAAESQRYALNNSVQFTDPASGTSKDVVFNKATGLSTNTVSVIIALAGGSGSRTITVNSNGRIDNEISSVTAVVTSPTYAAITSSGATLGAYITSDGGDTLIARGTCWETTANPVTHCVPEGLTTIGPFTMSATGMPSNTLIHYRGYATNSSGTAYSADDSFTTSAVGTVPTVTSPTFTAITSSGATLGANVTSDGGATITARGTCWGTSANPDITTGTCDVLTGTTEAFTNARTGMNPSTLIHYRGYATNSNGTAYSADDSFTTLAIPATTYTIKPWAADGVDTYFGSDFSPGPNNTTTTLSYGGWGDFYYDYFQFDLTNAPAAASVTDASFYVYATGTGTTDPTMKVYYMTAGWAEDTLTRTLDPAKTLWGNGPTGWTVANTWYSSSITGLYQDWKNGVKTNFGLNYTPTTTSSNAAGSLVSSDDPDPTFHPKLVITTNTGVVVRTDSITPYSGANGSSAAITSITGNNFASGATVVLQKTGETDITCTGFTFSSSTSLTNGSCPITGAAIGMWNLVVTNTNGSKGTLAPAFQIFTPTVPTVTSPTATALGGDAATAWATLGANVTSDGGATITARGTCWGTSANPDITTGTCDVLTGTTEAFTNARTGLPLGTLIYYRGYATNGLGTGYSIDGTFTSSGSGRYWVGGAGTWDAASSSHWSGSSGGAGGAVIPGYSNTVFFDANSGGGAVLISTAGGFFAQVGGFNTTGWTGTFSSGSVVYVGGHVTLGAGQTQTSLSIAGVLSTGIANWTTNGTTISQALFGYTSDGATATYNLLDDLTTINTTNVGSSNNTGTTTFNLNNHNITSGFAKRAYNGAGNPNVVINMGTGTWTVTGTGSIWDMHAATGLTLNNGTSTIKINNATSSNKTFTGNDLTYNNLWFTGAGTGSLTISGSNTFNDFKDNNSVAHSILFTAGTTTTVATFTVSGTAGNLITLNSTSTETYTLTKTGGGTVTSGYLNIQHSVATPASTWNADNSINNQSVATAGSGWAFTVAVPTITTPTVALITPTGATLGANVTSDGGGAITARGTCWDTTSPPAINCVADPDPTHGVIDGYSENNYETWVYSMYASNNPSVGQSFTNTNSTTLDSVKFFIRKVGSPTGNATVTIYAHSGTYGVSSSKTGSVLATSDPLDVSTLTTSISLKAFNFSGANRITLSASTYYVVIINFSGGDVSNYIMTGIDHASPTHSGNVNYTSDGISWFYYAGDDLIFYVYTTGPVGAFIQERVGLPSGTLIYYRGYATNETGTAYSADGSFTTGSASGKFWVGGTGNWSDDTNHWATSSGGVPGVGNVPTITDNCYFDASSFGAASQVVTVDVAANCADMGWTGVTNTPTFAGAAALNVYGSLTFSINMTQTYSGTITFKATTLGKTFTSAKQLAAAITFAGVGGGWQLLDNLNIGTSKVMMLTNGSLDTNNKTVTYGGFTSNNSNTRTLTLGSSTMTGYWQISPTTNLTFNKGTSAIVVPTNFSGGIFTGGGLTYNNVTINVPNATDVVSSANTFSNLTINGLANKASAVTFGANQIITGTLTVTGNSAANRLLIGSSTFGTPRTITAATVSVVNADFMDITGAGTGSWNLAAITGGSGDGGGNTGITFTPAVAQTANGTTSFSWSDATRWTSRVPLPQDDVLINNAFGISQIITADMPRWGKSVSFTGVTWTTALTVTINTSPTIFGSLTLVSGLTWTQNSGATFAGRGAYSITSAAVPFRQLSTINAPGGTYTLQDAYTNTNASGFTITNGTLNANNVAVNIQNLTMGASGTLLMGTNTWTLTGTGTVWTGAGTITPSSSTIKINNTTATAITFAGGSKIYNNVWFSRGASTASNTISGSNTFNDFKDDGIVAHSILFTAGTTQTVTTFTVSGTLGNLITINSTTTGTHALVKAGVGTISRDFLNIQHSVATPASTWYAGVNSTDNQAVVTAGSGWIFTAAPGDASP